MSTTMRRTLPLNHVTRAQRLQDERLHGWIARHDQDDADLLAAAHWLAEEKILDLPILYAKLYKRRGAQLLPVERAQGTGIDQMGGWLVPAAVADLILAYRQTASVVRQNVQVWPIARANEMSVPRRASAFTVSFTAENTALAENTLTWDSVSLSPKKVASYCRVSTEMDSDAITAWAQYLVEEFGNSIGLKEDDCGIGAADGSSTWAGMKSISQVLVDGSHTAGAISAASGHKTALTIDNVDIWTMMGALPEQYWPGAKLYMSAYMFVAGFGRLAGTAGMASMSNGQPVYGNVPVVLTPKLAGSGDQSGKVMALLGDMSKTIAFGSGRELTVSKATDRWMDLDQLGFRVTSRFHIVPHNLGDAAGNAGGCVALIGTA